MLKTPQTTDNLRKQALLGTLRQQLFLAALLFLPAWSWRNEKAWIFWALLLVCVLFNTFYFLQHDPSLIARRLQVGAAAERERNQKIIQGIASVLLCVLLVLPGFDWRFGWSSVSPGTALLADAVVLAGLLIVFATFRANSFAGATVQVEANQATVVSGPYALVRHPMYSGSVLAYLAAPIALGSLWALVPAVLLCAAIVLRLIDEERYLSAHLAGYREYCSKVRHRLIPGLW